MIRNDALLPKDDNKHKTFASFIRVSENKIVFGYENFIYFYLFIYLFILQLFYKYLAAEFFIVINSESMHFILFFLKQFEIEDSKIFFFYN